MQMSEDAAHFDGHREIDPVDRTDAVHSAEGEDDIVAIGRRYPSADEARVAALRHDRQPRLGANPHNRGDFGRRGWADNQPCGSAIQTTCFEEIGLLVMRIGNPAGGPTTSLIRFTAAAISMSCLGPQLPLIFKRLAS
jgi:hypothetical protein